VVLVAVAAAVLCLAPALAGAAEGRGADGDRAIELVSAIDRNNAYQLTYAKLSDDGERVLYRILGGVTGSPSGSSDILLATRTPGGWQSQTALPPADQQLGELYEPPAFTTPSLSEYFSDARSGFASHGPAALVRVTADGAQTPLHVFPDHLTVAEFGVATSDLRHLFVQTTDTIDPGHVTDTRNVYDFGSASPLLVSRLPDGSVPTCGVPVWGFAGPGGFAGALSQHWSSTDGSKVFFQSKGSDPSCSTPEELYRRDIATGTTTLISGPVASGPDNGVESPGMSLVQAAPDGSWVIYNTPTSLVASDTNGTPDLYKWTENPANPDAGTNTCLTCGLPEVSVVENFNTAGAVASQDGSRIYLQSNLPSPGTLYMLDRGVLRTVGATGSTYGVTANIGEDTDMTADGRVLVFASDDPAMDALTTPASDNTGCAAGTCLEYYRWDSDTGLVTCVSCSPPGVPAAGVSFNLAPGNARAIDSPHALTADGSRFFFTTTAALVPQDVNGDRDVYEWHDGRVGLITDGTSTNTHAGNMETSPDGRDVLFSTTAIEAPGATPGVLNLYDARIGGGGFPVPPTPPPPCQDDQCQGPPAAPPAFLDPSSASLTGFGNLQPVVPPKPSGSSTREQQLRGALTACKRKHNRHRRRRCEVSARKRFGKSGGSK
jgi:hypothetical protein